MLDVARASGADGLREIRPPRDERVTFYIADLTEVRAGQVRLHLDRHDGTLRNRVTFEDHPPIAKAVCLGIAFHQGELYGWLNVA